MHEKFKKILDAILVAQDLCRPGKWSSETLSGDGSDRIFFRVVSEDTGKRFMVVFPAESAQHGMREAVAAWRHGRHFHKCGAAVPTIFAFDQQSGALVFEDFGDTLLHGFIQSQGSITEQVLRFYFQAVEKLAHLQVNCRSGFEVGYCWDTPRYDMQLMLIRESGYFYNALCRNLLGFGEMSHELEQDFVKLARRAAEEPADYVLHRDFQSRNLMISEAGIGIIDYQGARLGPLAYDLASLLIDPYANLPVECRQKILSHYLEAVNRYIPLDRQSFIEGYYFIALQRNLQILGAFSFLWKQREKNFFQQFIKPAAENLQMLLTEEQGRDFPVLLSCVDEILPLLKDSGL